jgi:PAS domain S-box-containing protein
MKGGLSSLARSRLWSCLALALCLSGAVCGWRWSLNQSDIDVREHFDARARRIAFALQQRMVDYELVLRGARGLFLTSADVDRTAWRAYLESLRIGENYPGVQGLGFARFVQAERPSEGERVPIEYVEPLDYFNKRAVGYDLFSEEVRREALLQARDSGLAALTGKLVLVQELAPNAQAGCVLFLAVYAKGAKLATVEQRRSNLLGFVFATFRMNDLVEGVLGNELERVRVRLFDGMETPSAQLFDSAEAQATSLLSKSIPLDIHGRPWRLRVDASQRFLQEERRLNPWLILCGGASISFLLFIMVRVLETRKTQAQALAARMTSSLRESEANFRLFFEASEDFLFVAGLDGVLLHANATVYKRLGYEPRELLGAAVGVLHPEVLRGKAMEFFRAALVGQVQGNPLPLLRKDGECVPVETRMALGSWSGKPAVFGVSKDLSGIKESEEKFAKAFQTSAVLMAIGEYESGKFIEVNETFLETLGYSREEVLGKTARELGLYPGEGRGEQILDMVRQKGRIKNYELPLRTKDGRTRYGALGVDLIQLQRRRCMLSVMVDITERKLAESAQRAASLYARSLIEASLDPLVTIGLDGRIMDANKATEEITGVSLGRLVGTEFADYFTEPGKAREGYRRVLSQGFVTDYPLVIRHGSGACADVLYNATLFKDEAGRLQGVFAAARNVTERVQAEKALELSRREAEARAAEAEEGKRILDALMEHVPEGVAIADARGCAGLYMSRYGLETIQRKAEPTLVLGGDLRALLALFHVQNGLPASNEETPIHRAAMLGRIIENEEWLMARWDGERFPILCNAGPILDAEGRALAGVMVWRDISEMKKAERALSAAKAAAEAASSAKSDFLANMSHEIRTPISGVLGMIDMALDTEQEDQRRERLLAAKAAGKSLLRIINDILDYSKIEAGKLVLCVEPFHMEDLLDSVVAGLEPLARDKSLPLEAHVSSGFSETLVGDTGRVKQVLVNLIANAIKFTSTGLVSVEVKVVRADADESGRSVEALFVVKDTGIGIPPDKLECLFQPFSQLDSSSGKRFQGTGLGLSICKQLVDMMRGRIWVESEPGVGSAFFFTARFPVVREGAPSKALSGRRGVRPPAASILMAEDDALNRTFLSYVLGRAGHEVTHAGNGLEVLAAMAQRRFDLVLMDIQMPSMGGDEAARGIREREASGELPYRTPIIALTAYAMPDEQQKFLEIGMDAVVLKPVDTERLFEVMDRVLSLKTVESDREGTARPPAPSAQAEVFDEKAMSEYFRERRDVWRTMLDSFCATLAEEYLGALREALSAGDLAESGKAAHKLKGAFAALCAPRCRDSAAEVERAARENNALEARDGLARLEDAMNALLSAASAMKE